MLYPLLFRPLLFQLDPERAHELGLWVARHLSESTLLSNLVHAVTGHSQPICVAGLTFPNPVGLAGGLDKNGVAARAWWAFGFGFVELGTVTPRPQPGNPRPRMYRISERQAIVNRMGFNNEGAAALAARLARTSRPLFPIGISIGKNATTSLDRAADDYAAAAAVVAPHADFVSVNVSSPNTVGLRGLQNPSDLAQLVAATKAVIGGKPLFVKLAPELDGDSLRRVLDAACGAGAVGIIATNTLAQFDSEGKPLGGLSGPPLREIVLRRVEVSRKHVGDAVAVIGCGGIDDVKSAREMRNAGADLIQIYTGLVYRGPFLPARLARGLHPTGNSSRKPAPTPPSAGR
ncbi:MAG TPA: quinone-dependent dihydroorotate dehydrogenase [Fimbriiglobus sp.]|jgi:dihydroorotate dehydrogenase